jgi:hypothetical protein
MVVIPRCAVCGISSACVGLVVAGQVPGERGRWRRGVQDSVVLDRRPGRWYLLFRGAATCTGDGGPIDASRAGSPRPARPGSTVTRDCAKRSMLPAAAATGMSSKAAVATALVAAARAWTALVALAMLILIGAEQDDSP